MSKAIDSNRDVYEAFGLLAWAITRLIIQVMVGGYVLMQLFNWFVAPAFEVNAIPLPIAIGLGCIMSLAKTQQPLDEETSHTQDFAITMLRFGAMLLIGFIAVQFVPA
jgi:hypothetical protein